MPKAITQEEFLNRINTKFNNKFSIQISADFSLDKEIKIICPVHGIIIMSGRNMLYSKCGCPQCAADVRNSNSKTTQLTPWAIRVAEFKTIHNSRYTYEETHVGNNKSKIKICCNKHGFFEKHLFSHLAGKGCPLCRTESTKIFNKRRQSTEERNRLAKENRAIANRKRALGNKMPLETAKGLIDARHGNTFSYNWNTYNGWSHPLLITCKLHGEFTQTCKDHVAAARGCPSCARISKSRLEDEWLTSLGIINRQHKIKLDGKMIKVDGYDPNTNTVYEFLGDYWHGHPNWHSKLNGINANNKIPFTELFEQTKVRFDRIKNLCYNVVYVWENDVRINNIVSRIFIDHLEV